MKEIEIVYRGRRVAVKEVEEMGGMLDDLHDFNDTLLRDGVGNYYLKQERSFRMPPNAEQACREWDVEICNLPLAERPSELKRFRAFRLKHRKPRVTIKRIKEKTALLWWVHQMANDEQMRMRLRDAVKLQDNAKA
jgi:hypothetical protein